MKKSSIYSKYENHAKITHYFLTYKSLGSLFIMARNPEQSTYLECEVASILTYFWMKLPQEYVGISAEFLPYSLDF